VQTDGRHNFVNILLNFEQFNYELQRYGWVIKTFMMKSAAGDFLRMILMPKFWLFGPDFISTGPFNG
jgi:hypothetical protein